MVRAVLDSNVLFGGLERDLLLELAFQGEYEPFWCMRILTALSRHLEPKMVKALAQRYEQDGMSPDDAQERARIRAHDRISGHLLTQITTHFPEAMLLDSAWQEKLPLCTNDPEDRHVLATALASGATCIVTRNLKDFPPSALAPHGVEALAPDAFLCEHFEPAVLLEALDSIKARHKNPPSSTAQLLHRLEDKHHLKQTVRTLRQTLASAREEE